MCLLFSLLARPALSLYLDKDIQCNLNHNHKTKLDDVMTLEYTRLINSLFHCCYINDGSSTEKPNENTVQYVVSSTQHQQTIANVILYSLIPSYTSSSNLYNNTVMFIRILNNLNRFWD